jgi:hypothetical protein
VCGHARQPGASTTIDMAEDRGAPWQRLYHTKAAAELPWYEAVPARSLQWTDATRVSRRAGSGGYPTMTAAAMTVVHRPLLSPTAVCVMFCVRTI